MSDKQEHVITLLLNFTDLMDITFYTLYIPEYPKYPMGMGIGMGMTFENEYGCAHRYTRPEPASCPSLLMPYLKFMALNSFA